MIALSRTELQAKTLAATGLGMLLRRTPSWHGVVTLAYHRIGHPGGSLLDHALWSATAESFDQQVQFLKRNFDVISPLDLPEARRDPSGRYVIITFDDGYRDNHDVAFPILRSHNVSGTFFIATGFIDNPRLPWWDEIAWMVRSSRRDRIKATPLIPSAIPFTDAVRESAVEKLLALYKALPGDRAQMFLSEVSEATGVNRPSPDNAAGLWMTWDMLRQMQTAGMCIGGHTHNHPILARLPKTEQAEEISMCQRRLQAELGNAMRVFSYPRGKPDAFNSDTRDCLADCGVEMAFTYYGGYRRFESWDPLDIRRTPVELCDSHQRFTAALTLPQLFA